MAARAPRWGARDEDKGNGKGQGKGRGNGKVRGRFAHATRFEGNIACANCVSSGVGIGVTRRHGMRSMWNWRAVVAVASLAMALCAACALSAPAAMAQNDQDKKDDGSFSAGVTVNSKADAKAVGLPVYPGSRPHKDNSEDSSAANLGLWGGSIGFKLSVMKLETDAAPAKVAEYYRKAMSKYGKVLDCTNAPALTQEQKDADEKSNTLACDNDQASPAR